MAEATLALMLLNHVVNGFLGVVQIELVIFGLLLLLALFFLIYIGSRIRVVIVVGTSAIK